MIGQLKARYISKSCPYELSTRRFQVFRWDIVGQYLFSGLFISAAWTTLWIAVISQTCGVIIGLFLALNRHQMLVDQIDAVEAFFNLAEGNLSELQLADWIHEHTKRER